MLKLRCTNSTFSYQIKLLLRNFELGKTWLTSAPAKINKYKSIYCNLEWMIREDALLPNFSIIYITLWSYLHILRLETFLIWIFNEQRLRNSSEEFPRKIPSYFWQLGENSQWSLSLSLKIQLQTYCVFLSANSKNSAPSHTIKRWTER